MGMNRLMVKKDRCNMLHRRVTDRGLQAWDIVEHEAELVWQETGDFSLTGKCFRHFMCPVLHHQTAPLSERPNLSSREKGAAFLYEDSAYCKVLNNS